MSADTFATVIAIVLIVLLFVTLQKPRGKSSGGGGGSGDCGGGFFLAGTTITGESAVTIQAVMVASVEIAVEWMAVLYIESYRT